MARLLSRYLLIFLLLGTGIWSVYAEESATETNAAVNFPGPGEIGGRLARLKEDSLQMENRFAQLQSLEAFDQQIEMVGSQFDALQQTMAGQGEPEQWYPSRLLDFKARLDQHQEDVQKLLQPISDRLGELDLLRKDWLGRQVYWKDWRAALEDQKVQYPNELIQEGLETIAGMLKKISVASAPLLQAQEKVLTHQGKLQALSNRIDNILSNLREQTFQRNDRALFQAEFYRQFNSRLWEAVKQGASSALTLSPDFFRRHSLVIASQLLLLLLLPVLIVHYRRKEEGAAEWQFMLHHPVATALFVAVAGLSLLYVAPPPFWKFGQALLGSFAAAILITGIIRNPRRRLMVWLVASVFVISLALKLIALPVPLYRLYLLVLTLLGIPLLLVLARRNLRAHRGRATRFTIYLRLGAAVFALSLFAQINGYATLAALLIEATVETVILALFTLMALRLSKGGIEWLFSQPFVRNQQFLRLHGKELGGRLTSLVQFFIVTLAILYLPTIWGMFGSMGDTLDKILGLEYSTGEFTLSVKMVVLVVLVLYLSTVLSWFLRAFLETQVFPSHGFDRGVRDAVKKLLHYSLVLVGFLIAVSFAGIELKNFTVLAGALGVGIGFGLQNIVNNFISGLILLFERPIKVGDTVVIDEVWGRVSKIGLRSTVVETLDQSEIIVPNSQLISEKVTNWTLTTVAARLVVPVGVAYGSDVPLVLKILQEVGEGHSEVLSDPPVSPIFTGFGDSSLDFELRTWLSDINKRFRVRSELLQEIDRRFREEGVEIPFPQRDLHLRSVDKTILGRLEKPKAEEEGNKS